jgi:hypothetical protein
VSNPARFIKIEELDLSSHKKAVLYYHGAWSGPSVRVFRLLQQKLASLIDPPALLVLNAEDFAHADDKQRKKITQLFGPDVAAFGETCWIKEGKVMAQDVLGKMETEQAIDLRLKELFA